jgi:hypothetical protein
MTPSPNKIVEDIREENKIDENKYQIQFVDVNSRQGKVEQVVIFMSDTSIEVTRNFVQKHGKSFNLINQGFWDIHKKG